MLLKGVKTAFVTLCVRFRVTPLPLDCPFPEAEIFVQFEEVTSDASQPWREMSAFMVSLMRNVAT